MPYNKKAYVYALAAVLCWSTVATAFKLTLEHIDIVWMLCIATWTSCIAMCIAVLVRGQWRQLHHQSTADWMCSAGTGFLNPFLYYLILFAAYDRLPAQEAQPLNYTWPLVLSLLSVPIMGQTIRANAIFGLCVSFCGVILIATRGAPWTFRFSDPLGCGLAVGSSVVWASYWLWNMRDRRSAEVKLLMGFLFGALYITPVALFIPGTQPSWALAPVLGAIYIGLFEMGLAFIFWFTAMHYAKDNASISNLAYLSPFISLLFIHFVLGEDLIWSSYMGLTLIISGILLHK